MNIMKRLTWRSMVKNCTRTIVTTVGIALAAALFCIVTTMGASILRYLIDLQIAVGGNYHVSATTLSDEQAHAVRIHTDIESIAEVQVLGVVNFYGEEFGPNSGLVKALNGTYYEAMPEIKLVEGRLPQNSSELVIGEYLIHTMEVKGYPTTVGSEITLPVTPAVETMGQGDPSAPEFTITGTIVGISPMSETIISPEQAEVYSYIYTYLDENTPSPLYHDLFLKAVSPYKALDLAADVKGNANYQLLQYYGLAEAGNITIVMVAMMAFIVATVMVATVSLISNAFSISVAQRTHDFGLLFSVGTTKKQLQKSVRYEAVILCLLGISIGLVLGFLGTVLLLNTSGDTVESMLALSQAEVKIKAIANPIALLLAAGITVGTVFLSARRPSARAAKITPIMAIRQSRDYRVDKKRVKTARKWWDPGKVSANIASKYYHTNKKKYRSIVAALGISVVLFLAATAVSTSLQKVAISFNTENCDFHVFVHSGDQNALNQVRNHESVSESVLYDNELAYAIIPEGYESQQRLDAFQGITPIEASKVWRTNPASIYYLEDDVFRAFLQEQGIDPAPYFDNESPLAAVFYHNVELEEINPNGEKNYTTITVPPLREDVKEITFVNKAPDVEAYVAELVKAKGHSDVQWLNDRFELLEDGRLVFKQTVQGCRLVQNTNGLTELVQEGEPYTFVFLAVKESSGGQSVIRYYTFDEATGAVGSEVMAEQPSGDNKIGIGAQIDAIPFGVSMGAKGSYRLTLLRPLSALEQSEGLPLPALCIRTSNYPATKGYLDEISENGSMLVYNDYLAEQYQMRQVSKLINLFAYTLVSVMTLISVANIFNIVSTNILLRRKDIGMLRSLGMTVKGIRAMTAREYAMCGIRALCWSLPIGLVSDYLIKRIIGLIFIGDYVFPWVSLAIIIGCVVIVVGSSVVYALGRIRKDNPIDAIRMENT